MPRKGNPEKEAGSSKTVYKGMSLTGFGSNAITTAVDVKDGKIIRLRPLHYDSKYDPKTFNQWKFEAHGKTFEPIMKTLQAPYNLAYKKRVYSPNRILYPMKRVDWDPKGERNPQNRGKSGYVRISWDEALDTIVSEIKRIKKQYGMSAILSQSDGHGEGKAVHTIHGSHNKLLELLGGYTWQIRNMDSWEGWSLGAKHVWGMEPLGEMVQAGNIMPDIAKNSGMLLFWGCDPETTPWGFNGQQASRLCYWFTDLGIKQVYVCPEVNYGAAVHADKWIPVLPNTDAAMQLAIAYTWIKEGTYDKKYIATHTYGYQEFEDYVLGKEDGIAKTPEWASAKCGVPEWTIKALAREWAQKATTTVHGNGGSYIRGPYSTEPARLEIFLLAMQGLGKPGANFVKMIEWSFVNDNKFASPMPTATINPWNVMIARAPWLAKFTQFIPKCLIHDALNHPPISWYGNSTFTTTGPDQFVKYTYPKEGCSEIHMVFTDTPCWTTCWNDGNSFIKGLQNPKIEFVLAKHPWMENDCNFADILLPVNTKFEEEDFGWDFESGQYHTIFHEAKAVEPYGETKTDYEIACMLAERFGLLKEYTGGKTVDEKIKEAFDGFRIEKKISFDKLKKNGYYVFETDSEWFNQPAGLLLFHDDPVKNPLKTPTGKIEFVATNLRKHFPDDIERPPVPHWIEKGKSHDERISSQRANKYPLLLMSNHGRWRVHANMDDLTWIREIPTCKVQGPDGYKYEPLWINPADASKRGIQTGDIISVYNERGIVLGGAYVTQRMKPGVVYMDHGARLDPIVPGEIDRGGAINTITPHNITSKNAVGMATSGFLVEVEMTDIDDLRKKYPEAFNRAYDSGAGLRLEGRMHKQ